MLARKERTIEKEKDLEIERKNQTNTELTNNI
jgi:hypothetical protein